MVLKLVSTFSGPVNLVNGSYSGVGLMRFELKTILNNFYLNIDP